MTASDEDEFIKLGGSIDASGTGCQTTKTECADFDENDCAGTGIYEMKKKCGAIESTTFPSTLAEITSSDQCNSVGTGMSYEFTCTGAPTVTACTQLTDSTKCGYIGTPCKWETYPDKCALKSGKSFPELTAIKEENKCNALGTMTFSNGGCGGTANFTTCSSATDQTKCEKYGCTYTPAAESTCSGTFTAKSCEEFNTSDTCLNGCTWSPAKCSTDSDDDDKSSYLTAAWLMLLFLILF